MRGRLIGPKTWDRVVRIFLGFLERPVTVQKIRGLFGSLNCENLALNACICMEKDREWAVGSVPKHGTELWKFLEILGCP